MASDRVKYDDREYRRMRGEFAEFGRLQLRVGVLGPGATALEHGSSLTLAELMMIHEYGAVIERDGVRIEIPARAPIAKTMVARRRDIAELQVQMYRRVLAGQLTARRALELLGVQVAAWIRETIRAGLTPPNAASTIARKKSSTPLVDHGQLINSVHFEVIEVAASNAGRLAA